MTCARRLDIVVQSRQLGVEQRVVVAELEQLRVGKLQDVLQVGILLSGLHHQRAVPRHDGQVIAVIAEAVGQQFSTCLGAQRPRFIEQQRHHIELRQRVGLERRSVGANNACRTVHRVVFAHLGYQRTLDRQGNALGEQPKVMIGDGRERLVMMQRLAEGRERRPAAMGRCSHLYTQRDHAEVEDARRELHFMCGGPHHQRFGAQQYRDGRVADLQRLPFTAHRPHAFRTAGGEQVECPLQVDGVAHVEEPVGDGRACFYLETVW